MIDILVGLAADNRPCSQRLHGSQGVALDQGTSYIKDAVYPEHTVASGLKTHDLMSRLPYRGTMRFNVALTCHNILNFSTLTLP